MSQNALIRIARKLIRDPAIYGLLRTTMLVGQRLLRRADEPDLCVLGRLPKRDDELIFDVGANGGQSAMAFSYIRPGAKIVSFEPVSALWPELRRVGRLIGARFQFRPYALSDEPGSFDLFIPVSGKLPITTRASISKEAALENCVELERGGGLPTHLEHEKVQVRLGDNEGLRPTIIKIDVEGAEFQVVRGLAQTIANSRPVVLLERSSSFSACRDFFLERGYEVFGHQNSDGLRALPGLSERNWIAAPPELSAHLLNG